MKALIKTTETHVGNATIKTVSARDLYLGLGLDKSNWTRWSAQNIEENEFFVENIDWVKLVIMTSLSATGQSTQDYAVSIDFAKHIAMMCKTAKGHEYRGYFLDLEKRVLSNQNASLPSFKDALEGVAVLADYLRLPESGRLLLVQPVIAQYGVNVALPAYGIDAPIKNGLVTTSSSQVTKSATALLKEHGVDMSAVKFNKLLEQQGLIVVMTRASSKNPDKLKSFWSVTTDGEMFGKNVTSPSNPRETTPHWYADRFTDLMNLVI